MKLLIDGTKEFWNRLSKEEKNMVREVLKTPISKLLKEVKDCDYIEKKELIDQINTFKAIYKKTGSIITKETIADLLKKLEEVNGRIGRIKELMKGRCVR